MSERTSETEAKPGSDRVDPVEPLYSQYQFWEHLSERLGWLAVAAFGVYAWLHHVHDGRAEFAKLSFVLLTVLSVCIAYVSRYLLQPRADRERRKLLLSDALGERLTAVRQRRYYNNPVSPSLERMLLILAENTFFFPRLLKAELPRQLFLCALVTVALLVGLRFGTAELVELLAVLVLFGELGLGKTIRWIWVTQRMHLLHGQVAALVTSRHEGVALLARSMELAMEYDYIKAKSGVRASDKTLERLNKRLSEEWEAYLRNELKIASSPRETKRTH